MTEKSDNYNDTKTGTMDTKNGFLMTGSIIKMVRVTLSCQLYDKEETIL